MAKSLLENIAFFNFFLEIEQIIATFATDKIFIIYIRNHNYETSNYRFKKLSPCRHRSSP